MDIKQRTLAKSIEKLHNKSRGRLMVLTGARQVGKSTLAVNTFDSYPNLSLDSAIERNIYTRLQPNEWIEQFPKAIIDEVQKSPELFDTIKAVYDRETQSRYILLGSSQLLLLKGVRESLAGRAAIRELYPFTLPELSATEEISESKLIHICKSENPASCIMNVASSTSILTPEYAKASKSWNYFIKYGGMPALLKDDWDNTDRIEWLTDYQKTFLQRDLMDLARLDHLEPFVKAQKIAALQSAQAINFSSIGRAAGITSPTAKKFIQYLEISYQVHMLQPWFKNQTKRLSKMPKLHFIDPGVRRSILQKQGDIDGAEFESAVFAEVLKQTKNYQLPIQLYHLRSSDGREVDILIEREDGYIAIECKMGEHVSKKDIRHLVDLDHILDKPLLISFVISSDMEVKRMHSEKEIWNIPAPLFLS